MNSNDCQGGGEFYLRKVQLHIHPGLFESLVMTSEETESRRREMECSDIETDITDRDMLLVQIDASLDDGDEKRFVQLTNELKRMEVLV